MGRQGGAGSASPPPVFAFPLLSGGFQLLSVHTPALGPAACCPCGFAAINEAAMCSQLERGWIIALGRFMVGRCEVPAVCLPPHGSGSADGLGSKWPGGQLGKRDVSLWWGKGELIWVKEAALAIPGRMQVVRCGALVSLPALGALSGCLEKHTGMSKCTSEVSDSALYLLRSWGGERVTKEPFVDFS